jgi:nitroreductase
MLQIKNFLLKYYDKILRCFRIVRYFTFDTIYTLRNSKDSGHFTKDKSDANIMLVMHSIEKGMSFSNKKQGWGSEKSERLTNLLERHISLFGIDNRVIVAINILNQYLNDPFSTKAPNIRQKIKNLLSKNNILLKDNIGGVKKIVSPIETVLSYEQILNFYKSRSSVRSFSEIHITDEEIIKAKQIANFTPSACNRQSSKLYYVRDRKLIDRVLLNQFGGQGWCENADVLFVITSNSSFFSGEYERFQPYIDGGMYAINFDMALHALNIASCFKMYIRTPQKDVEFKKIIGIPCNEIPIILIFAGHYSDKLSYSPMSHRYYDLYK